MNLRLLEQDYLPYRAFKIHLATDCQFPLLFQLRQILKISKTSKEVVVGWGLLGSYRVGGWSVCHARVETSGKAVETMCWLIEAETKRIQCSPESDVTGGGSKSDLK